MNIGKNTFKNDYTVHHLKVLRKTVVKPSEISGESFVDSENVNLVNKISYNFNKNSTYLNIAGILHEDISVKNNTKYEYILPNILFGKSFDSEKFGTVDFKSNAL